MEKQTELNTKLTCITYNCEYADNSRLPYMQKLYQKCDFLFIQEHGLYKSQFGWFDNIGQGVGKHGVSAMDESKLLHGRPNGGAAIIWHPNLKADVKTVDYDSKRVCAVYADLSDGVLLLICVYMPCDDRRPNHNLLEYKHVLNDIDTICNMVDAKYVSIGGDFNTDLIRNSYQTHELVRFIDSASMCMCVNDPCSTVDYTYCSRGSGATSQIDHFVISENAIPALTEYYTLDAADNFSEHFPVVCTLDFKVEYIDNTAPVKDQAMHKPAWHRATPDDLINYKNYCHVNLSNVPIPHGALLCNDKNCTVHKNDINVFHENIISALLDAGDKAIPVSRPSVSKVLPGWNDHVDDYFRASLFWHDLWNANGRPKDGLIADLRRKTRSEYHKTCKMVMRREGEIRSDKMAQALSQKSVSSFYREARKMRSKKTYYPNKVDGASGEADITDVFANKFRKLYNCVSYDEADMNVLKNDINVAVNKTCLCNNCIHGNHCISFNDCSDAIKKLKHSKSDGSTGILSDHIIHAGDRLIAYLSLLFTAMLRHGTSPDGMLLGTMIPLPKGKWANLTSTENFRAITLSSIFGKLLDFIILCKEEDTLCTSELQFSFKKGSSTTLCTSMAQETVSYFVHNGTNVYGMLLDASKAFDRVNYCKLFRLLLDRGFCPMYSRLLINMYTNQKLRVRWNGTISECFSATNGVKQGGVISPILFCVYMDGLLTKLANSKYGCYMGGVFAGAFGYADDLKLLAPSVFALHKMAQICESYAQKFDILFNAKKSQVIIYKAYHQTRPPDPCVKINGAIIKCFEKVVHLGHLLTENVYDFNMSKCIDDFNRQCNMFFADFKNCNSQIRNYLFQRYCSSFYGVQMLPQFDSNIHDVYTAWRIAIRRVWRVPWRTHNNMLAHIAGVMDPEFFFAKRSIKFIEAALDSKNVTVKTISNMGRHGTHSIMGANYRHFKYKYDMNVLNVNQSWKNICENNCEIVRVCEQVKELIDMRDRCVSGVLNRGECKEIIDYLCTC